MSESTNPDLLAAIGALVGAGVGSVSGSAEPADEPPAEVPEDFIERLEQLEMRANGLDA